MPSCHESLSFAQRAFMITPYYASDEGAFAAVLPDRCLDTAACAGCEISVHHLRARRTGPQFPLTVVHCKTHGHAFTLYPPGHVPYGRVAVAPVSASGAPILLASSVGGVTEPDERRELGWDATIVAAALDGAAGAAWPREYDESNLRWWHTQGRRVARAAELFGIGAGDEGRRAEMAEQLGIAHLELRQGMRRWAEASGYRSRGQAVVEVVRLLGAGRCICDQVIAAGSVAGLWGPASRWDPATRVLRAVGLRRPRPP